MNIIFPIAGSNVYFNNSDFVYPKPLIEIFDKPLIELAVEPYRRIKKQKKLIFVVNRMECVKYNFDRVLKLLEDDFTSVEVISLNGITKGALCTCLLTMGHVELDQPLIIANYDQILDQDLNQVIDSFDQVSADAGVLCISSIHPRWSFVRIDESGAVLEAAEKNPISKSAIAGFYYYKSASMFFDSAVSAIENDDNYMGDYFVSSTFNQLILSGKAIQSFTMDNNQYHSFYSPEKVSEYEMGSIEK